MESPPPPGDQEPASEPRFDFFVSFAGPDRAWARWLTQQLEDLGFSVEFADRWPAGRDLVAAMNQALERADRVLAVFSRRYFEEFRWTGPELRSALFRAHERHPESLVPVRIDDVDPPPLYDSYKRIELADLEEPEARDALLHGLYPGTDTERRQAFPGATAAAERPTSARAPFPSGAGGQGQPPTTASAGGGGPDPIELTSSNLPHFLDAFVGRAAELATYRQELLDGRTRLLTILGAGGAGKTRFCQELGRSLLDAFDQHVYFVDLTTVSEPDLVIASITRAMRIKAGDPVLEALKELFRDRRVLLLLDNFEHVYEGAPAVEQLLLGTASVSVVATSRRPLDISGEAQHDLTALTPDEAVRLFEERSARSGAPPLSDASSEAEAVVQLCQRLDYLPLAIELVAARAQMHPPTGLLSMLRRSALDLRATGQGVAGRQRSLRDTVEWSYNLLDEPAQRLFRQLAVFEGGWTFTTAARLLGDGDPYALSLTEPMYVLLRNQLIRVNEQRTRMAMLTTLREYAADRLKEDPEEAESLAASHAQLFLDLAEEVAPGLSEAAAFGRLELEQDNLAAALDYFVDRDEVEQALRLAAVLGRFWWVRDYAEGWERLSAVLRKPVPAELQGLRAPVLRSAVELAIRLGRLDEAASASTEFLELARRLEDRRLEAFALSRVALVQMEHAEFDEALPLLEQALSVQHEVGDAGGVADTLDSLGVLATGVGDHDRARERLEQSRIAYRELGDTGGEAWACNDLARLALAQQQFAEAEQFAQEALRVGEQQTDWALIAWAHNYLGLVTSRRGAHKDAREHHLTSLAQVLLLGDKRPCALALEGLAALAAEQGQAERAAVLDGAAQSVRERSRIPRTRAEAEILERRLDLVRPDSAATAFEGALARGRRMSLEEAVALARGA